MENTESHMCESTYPEMHSILKHTITYYSCDEDNEICTHQNRVLSANPRRYKIVQHTVRIIGKNTRTFQPFLRQQ